MSAHTAKPSTNDSSAKPQPKKISKFDLRAQALRENLLRRKAFQRAQADKQAEQKAPPPQTPEKKDT